MSALPHLHANGTLHTHEGDSQPHSSHTHEHTRYDGVRHEHLHAHDGADFDHVHAHGTGEERRGIEFAIFYSPAPH